MDNAIKELKTIIISEVTREKTSFFVTVEDHANDDSVEEQFDTLAEAEEYASDVAKRPLKPFDIDTFPHVRR
jgi:hypothetical protein